MKPLLAIGLFAFCSIPLALASPSHLSRLVDGGWTPSGEASQRLSLRLWIESGSRSIVEEWQTGQDCKHYRFFELSPRSAHDLKDPGMDLDHLNMKLHAQLTSPECRIAINDPSSKAFDRPARIQEIKGHRFITLETLNPFLGETETVTFERSLLSTIVKTGQWSQVDADHPAWKKSGVTLAKGESAVVQVPSLGLVTSDLDPTPAEQTWGVIDPPTRGFSSAFGNGTPAGKVFAGPELLEGALLIRINDGSEEQNLKVYSLTPASPAIELSGPGTIEFIANDDMSGNTVDDINSILGARVFNDPNKRFKDNIGALNVFIVKTATSTLP